MKVVAIGGDAASMSAVSKLRRLDDSVEINVYEMGQIVSYGACGMPYFVSNEIKDSDALIARTKKGFEAKDIHVHLGHEVTKVNDTTKTITVKNLKKDKTFEVTYDKLIIGSGAHPVMPPFDNKDLKNIFTFTTIPDSIAVKKQMQSGDIKNVVVIGGGFIGIEMIEAFHNYDVSITLIELKEHILEVFDADMVSSLEKHLEDKGVTLNFQEGVTGFRGDEYVQEVITDQDIYAADLVLVAAGVIPNTQFLDSTRFKLAQNGALVVNKKMETSVKDVYAGGDCATIYHRLLDEQVYLPLGNNANKQGRLIAENIYGLESPIDGVLGTTVIKVIDMEAARTGISEAYAKAHNIPHKTVEIRGRNHAGYYPNAQKIRAKIIYEPSTLKLLGAQLVGRKVTALRINPFVVAISKGMTTKEFSMLDFGYAPPFAGVWDVIAIAASKAS
ncbi:MAG: CoA-disulfide reductase [Candidatus Izimaplasma sp.]|nr:CoA-disulfide reductase [Candidatus Izimaplasma bacterium]